MSSWSASRSAWSSAERCATRFGKSSRSRPRPLSPGHIPENIKSRLKSFVLLENMSRRRHRPRQPPRPATTRGHSRMISFGRTNATGCGRVRGGRRAVPLAPRPRSGSRPRRGVGGLAASTPVQTGATARHCGPTGAFDLPLISPEHRRREPDARKPRGTPET